MDKMYFTRDTVKSVKIPEDWRKLKNFQVVPPLTLEQQVKRFEVAGRKLEELAGLGVYDFAANQPLDDELEDITRDPDFDQIDAAVAARDAFLRAQSASADGTAAESPGGSVTVETENNSDSTNNSPYTEDSQQPTPAGD